MSPVLAPGAITDVAGLRVGHAACTGRPTGCTVILCPQGVTASVAVRGGAPGTRETDLLRPENTVEKVHALLLTGGSAFGLEAAGGVMRWLDERGHGLAVGPNARVPIVPAAVLFDLWLGGSAIRPGPAEAYAACEAASIDAPAQGSVGAGLGCSVGKIFGIARAMRGGIGTASLQVGGISVGALVAVNAVGDVLDEAGQVLAGARDSEHGLARIGITQALLAGAPRRPGAKPADPGQALSVMSGSATTIGVVATDAPLSKAQACQWAGLAHHGLSRCISPVTPNDGDTLFTLATGTAAVTPDLTVLGAMAAEVVARAIRNGVRAAQALPGLPAALGQAQG